MPPIPPENEAYGSVTSKSSVTISSLTEELIQVDDKVYSTIALAKIHPGGELFVRAFAGRDATEAFLSYHRRTFPHGKMSGILLGDKLAAKEPNADADFLELCQIVEKILPRHKSFAPFNYYVKVAFLLSVTVGLEFYMHFTGNYRWYITSVLGFFMALVGMNIQHDANHGAISRNPLVNRVLGWSQNWIGGSSIDWIHQHVVQHHLHTNEVHNDPDISGSDILRLNPLKPLLKYQATQHIYFFVLIIFFGFVMVISSFWHIVNGVQFTPFSKYLVQHRIFEASTSILFMFRWFVLPLIICPSVYTPLQIAPMFAVGGSYLAFFFIISHNFEGVYMFDADNKTGIAAEKTFHSFLHRQVASSSNVGGKWLAVLNGGLNYQIEHHLFPRIQHSHYHTIAPVVREYCLSKGIPYVHFPTVRDNMSACIAHLNLLGNAPVPVELNKKLISINTK